MYVWKSVLKMQTSRLFIFPTIQFVDHLSHYAESSLNRSRCDKILPVSFHIWHWKKCIFLPLKDSEMLAFSIRLNPKSICPRCVRSEKETSVPENRQTPQSSLDAFMKCSRQLARSLLWAGKVCPIPSSSHLSTCCCVFCRPQGRKLTWDKVQPLLFAKNFFDKLGKHRFLLYYL